LLQDLTLRFPHEKVDWNKRGWDVAADAWGETDLGHVDSDSPLIIE
jgi:hypothetical protein